MYTQITLKNGLTIVNFSSPHPFTFTTGEILPACEPEWVEKMSLDIYEESTERHLRNSYTRWNDIKMSVGIPDNVRKKLWYAQIGSDIDIILVPFMLLQALKDCDYYWGSDKDNIWKCRTIRCADRITKEIYPDRFCI
jgi:hypothetical protein|tara:strand:+ start:213 stop:626 length:414 start_codon:yes stop_codon:yes gene_type:complete